MVNLSLKFSGAFICAIFISSAGLNVYFFTKSNSNDLKGKLFLVDVHLFLLEK